MARNGASSVKLAIHRLLHQRFEKIGIARNVADQHIAAGARLAGVEIANASAVLEPEISI